MTVSLIRQNRHISLAERREVNLAKYLGPVLIIIGIIITLIETGNPEPILTVQFFGSEFINVGLNASVLWLVIGRPLSKEHESIAQLLRDIFNKL